MTLDVLFRDTRFAVVDKPAGLPVHASRADPDADTIEARFAMFGPRRAGPWLAHRLDRDTAGCLVIALRRAALIEAQACFAERRVTKTYWAAVAGDPGPGGTVRSRLRRIDAPRRTPTQTPTAWRIAEHPDGDPSETEWRRLGTDGAIAWLELVPRTGRTHQLRVHCASLGTPILGDPIYGPVSGPDAEARPPLHLLARAITLPLAPPVAATAPVPPHMTVALAACGHRAAP